jgi:hypothetical protein
MHAINLLYRNIILPDMYSISSYSSSQKLIARMLSTLRTVLHTVCIAYHISYQKLIACMLSKLDTVAYMLSTTVQSPDPLISYSTVQYAIVEHSSVQCGTVHYAVCAVFSIVVLNASSRAVATLDPLLHGLGRKRHHRRRRIRLAMRQRRTRPARRHRWLRMRRAHLLNGMLQGKARHLLTRLGEHNGKMVLASCVGRVHRFIVRTLRNIHNLLAPRIRLWRLLRSRLGSGRVCSRSELRPQPLPRSRQPHVRARAWPHLRRRPRLPLCH